MSERPKPAPKAVLGFCLAYGLLTLVMCLARGAWNLPLTSDNQHYFFIAERAAAGIPPHVSQFDPKHELSGLLGAAAIQIGDAVGLDQVHATRVLSLIVTSASVALAGWAAWLLAGVFAAHLASFFILSSSGFLYMGAMGCRPKVFLVFFSLATLVAVARRRPAAAGALVACTFLCWQPGLVLLPLAVVTLWPATGRAGTLRLGVAAVLIVALYHGYFLATDAWAPLIEQAYRFPAMYSEYVAPSLSEAITWFTRAVGAPQGERSLGKLFLVALAVGWFPLVMMRQRALHILLRRPGLSFCFAAAHATLAFTLLEHQGYPDVFFTFPFMAVISAVVIGKAFEVALDRFSAGRAARALVTAVVLAGVVMAAGARAWAYFPRQFSLTDQYRLGRNVDTLVSYGYTIYAVGCTHLLAFNGIGNYVPYGYFFRRINRYVIDQARRETGRGVYVPLVDGRLPDVILVSRWFMPWGYSWLERDYEEVTTQAFRNQGISVWLR